jgi:hypothetical protein
MEIIRQYCFHRTSFARWCAIFSSLGGVFWVFLMKARTITTRRPNAVT